MLKVSELQTLIADLPGDMQVCGDGHFGEQLEIDFVRVGNISSRDERHVIRAVIITMDDPGPAPE